MLLVRGRAVPTLALLLLAGPVPAATKIVDVGPGSSLTFVDEDSGTNTTTISVGDTVEWRWMSSGHSTTRSESPEAWDSGIQEAPFSFSHTFGTPGTFTRLEGRLRDLPFPASFRPFAASEGRPRLIGRCRVRSLPAPASR